MWKIITTLKENIGEYLSDLGIGKKFLKRPPKTLTIKETTYN